MLKKLFNFADRNLDRQIVEIVRYVNLPGLDLPVHADNAAALAAGLVENQPYRTATGQFMVVY